MLTLDYIIANEDRHYGNFGFIRDANTLEWKGLSPIFDSGTSLWYNANIGKEVESKPFRKSHDEQIKLVTELSWYNYGALDGIKDECANILSQYNIIDAERCKKIAATVAERCERIERIREQTRGRSAAEAAPPDEGIMEKLERAKKSIGSDDDREKPKKPKEPER
jgi:hypothetical protein